MVRRGPPKRAAKKAPKKPSSVAAEGEGVEDEEGGEEEAQESEVLAPDTVPEQPPDPTSTEEPALADGDLSPDVAGAQDPDAGDAAAPVRDRKQSSYLARRRFVAEEPPNFRRSGYAGQQPARPSASYAVQRGRQQPSPADESPAAAAPPPSGRVASPGVRRRLKSAFRAAQLLERLSVAAEVIPE
mmetsp:Transcript_70716/g.165841  ORF Transcript_70716/g.165841 Transcript_70716/m.165841 type:complete len:186 (+) Transcript_70716:19-576(+)